MQRRLWLMGMAGAGLLSAGGALLLARRSPSASGPSAVAEDDICIVAPTFSYDPATGLPPTAARSVPADARCPVCGMFPARYPRWAAQVIFADGDVQFLDSPLSLFHYLQRVERYTTGRRRADVAAVYVADHGGGPWLPLEQAVFVHGSSQLGPMRSGNLPAFASAAEAQAFAARHGGQALAAATLQRGLPRDLQQLAPHTHTP